MQTFRDKKAKISVEKENLKNYSNDQLLLLLIIFLLKCLFNFFVIFLIDTPLSMFFPTHHHFYVFHW